MRGRPSKYNQIIDKDVLLMVEKFCKLGSTNKEIADFLNVTVSTIGDWILNKREFSDAVKRGRVFADANVAEALYKKATGYRYEERYLELKANQEKGEAMSVTKVVQKEMPPDTAAAFIWLRNRRPNNWKQQPEGSESSNILKEIRVVKASDYNAHMEVTKKTG